MLFLQSIAMQQCNNYWSCGWEDRPTGGNPITASTALVVEDALSAWETLRRAQPVLRGDLSLWLEILHPMHCNVMEGGKSRRCFKGVIREQLLRLRGRETSNCRVVELSRTHSAHTVHTVGHTVHTDLSGVCTQKEPVLQKPTTAFARLLPSARNHH